MSNRSNRSALVFGLGVSGIAASTLLLREGVSVSAVDERPLGALPPAVHRLRESGVTVLSLPPAHGVLPLAAGDVPQPDLCVVSPGIPLNHPWLMDVAAAGIPVVSELELGASRCPLPILAVTGSNGKSSFVKLCGLALELAGMDPVLAGNYGTPLCEVMLAGAAFDWVVAEVSSFQLEQVSAFAPVAGVLLNIAPDHLDRHGDMATYTRSKARLFQSMSPDGVAVVDEALLDTVSHLQPRMRAWRTFGSSPRAHYRYEAGCVVPPDAANAERLDLERTPFDNPVMGLTAAAAMAVLSGLGVPHDALQTAVRGFEPLPHRMQTVAEKSGVLFIDDSKATNLAAMCGALRMVSRPVRLVAGGQFKEKDAELPKELLAKTTKSTYLVGESAEMLGKAWEDVVSCSLCGALTEAVQQAWRESEPGDVVLLSPGCASFDQFSGYHERGELFKSVVAELPLSRGSS